jgi:glycerophosphoryl diester phosphodiesterase
MICFAHRGAMGYRPENTLSSFELALEMGAPWIELDVHSIKGELVVIHDDKLERTTNGKGRIRESTFEYVRSLDAGEGQQVPTLREVLDLVDRRAGINVELKGHDTAIPVSSLLNNAIDNGWDPEQFLVSSFSHEELGLADPTFHRGALFGRRSRGDKFQIARELDAFSINPALEIVDSYMVSEAHNIGLKVFVYTVNEPQDIERMRNMGVDGVFTNYPDRVLGTT